MSLLLRPGQLMLGCMGKELDNTIPALILLAA